MAMTTVGVTIGLLAALTVPLGAQPLRGVALARIGRTPIANATIAARGGGVVTTDRLGRFALTLRQTPDTLVITAIGWVPDTIPVETIPAESLIVTLARTAVVLADLMATATPEDALDLSPLGRWQLPIQTARTVPPAVETDVYRALALIPAASFTSPLSARPLVRGYDAQEVVTRIDGFDAINLFHLGRIFSSYPADATDQIRVTPAPNSSAQAGSVAGIIDLVGRSGPVGQTEAGIGFSFGSLSAFAGGGNRQIRSFGAVRFFHLGALDLIPGVDLPYHFVDLYGGLVFGAPERPRGGVTLFATEDRAGHPETGRYLNWDNLVLGTRWRVVDRDRTTVEVATSTAQFRETGRDVPGLRTTGNTGIENRFGRVSVTADLMSTGPASRLAAGVSVDWRPIRNHLGETLLGSQGTAQFQPTTVDVNRPELGGYLEGTQRLGPVAVQVGLRADGAGSIVSIQPRLRTRWTVERRVALAAAAGRTSRLHHLLAEARSEPDLDFLDFWMNAGDSVPVARVDHATVDLNLDFSRIVGRISVFVSWGSGIGEVRPELDQRLRRFDFFRFGRSRTRGLEAQLGVRGDADRPSALSASYAYSVSERDWDEGWVRWAQDRRHQFRLFGQLRVARLTLFGLLDAASGMPATPVDYQFVRKVPGLPDPTTSPFGVFRGFGRENTVRTSGTFRVDAGCHWTSRVSRRTRLVLGLGIINLLQTEVAPIGYEGDGAPAVDRRGQATRYRRLFHLPGVPTITVRGEF